MRALIERSAGHALACVSALLFGAAQGYRLYVTQNSASPLILLFGALVGFIGLYLFSWLLRNFGRWFGAQAKLFEMRVALGWGLMPWTAVSMGLAIAIARELPAETLAAAALPLFVVFVYGYITILLSVAAGLQMSVLKAFLVLMVTCLVSIFPLILLAQFIERAFGVLISVS